VDGAEPAGPAPPGRHCASNNSSRSRSARSRASALEFLVADRAAFRLRDPSHSTSTAMPALSPDSMAREVDDPPPPRPIRSSPAFNAGRRVSERQLALGRAASDAACPIAKFATVIRPSPGALDAGALPRPVFSSRAADHRVRPFASISEPKSVRKFFTPRTPSTVTSHAFQACGVACICSSPEPECRCRASPRCAASPSWPPDPLKRQDLEPVRR